MMNFSTQNLQDLIREGLLKPGQFTTRDIKDCLVLARNHVKSAEDDPDPGWSYEKAFVAMECGATALLMRKGYRAVGKPPRPPGDRGTSRHLATVLGAAAFLGQDFAWATRLMQAMVQKRNIPRYQTPDAISSREAFEARETAARFVEAISELLGL
jgi:hypothetical protein